MKTMACLDNEDRLPPRFPYLAPLAAVLIMLTFLVCIWWNILK